MREASAAFGQVVLSSHIVSVRVDLLIDGNVFASNIPVVEGTVHWDRTAAHLASLSLTVPGSLESAVSDSLTPYGAELQVWRGVELVSTDDLDLVYDAAGDQVLDAIADGDDVVSDSEISPTSSGYIELVSLGVFPIQTVSVDGVSQIIRIEAEDRSRTVSDALFEEDYFVAAGTNYATAIEAIIEAGVSGFEYVFPTTVHTTPKLTFAAEGDRWEQVQSMARSIGNELYFDGLGRCRMRPEPSFRDAPVVTISEGVNMVDVSSELDRLDAYNRVIAVSRNASNDAVYRAVATDSDPESASFYDGPFGRKPQFLYSEFIASNRQAAEAAEAALRSNLGVAEAVGFSMIPDPRLETSDVVSVVNSVLGIDQLHIVDELEIGLSASQLMTGLSRTQLGSS